MIPSELKTSSDALATSAGSSKLSTTERLPVPRYAKSMLLLGSKGSPVLGVGGR